MKLRLLWMALLAAVLHAPGAWAELYKYGINNPSSGYHEADSALGACVLATNFWNDRYPGLYTNHTVTQVSPGSPLYICRARIQGSTETIGTAQRTGDSCPPNYELNEVAGKCDPIPVNCPEGTELDPATNQCVEPKDCSSENGQPILTRGSIGGVINSGGRNYVASRRPESACVDSCRYVARDGQGHSSSCYLLSDDHSQGFCNYTLFGNGETCSGWDWDPPQTGDPLNPPDTPDVPPSDPNDPGCPSGYAWSGTTCAKKPSDGNGGDGGSGGDDGGSGGGGSGGSGNGSGGSGSGGGNGSGDGGGDGTGSGGDGTGTGGGSGGNGDGNGGGGDGSGDGNGGGSGDGSGNGNGNGNGNGDGDGDGSGSGGGNGDGEEGEDDSSVGGEPCDATLTCEGDAVQCAILRQQKELQCHLKKQDDFNEYKADIKGLVQGENFQVDEGGGALDVPSFINQGTRFLSPSCPPAETFSLRLAGGHSFQLSYEPLCRAASSLSGLFVAVATVMAALYVGRSVGGQ